MFTNTLRLKIRNYEYIHIITFVTLIIDTVSESQVLIQTHGHDRTISF